MTASADPRERLRRWVDAQASRSAAAKAIGCHSSYLTHILAAESVRRPGLDVAFAIERATVDWPEGVIRAEEWTASPIEGLPATGTDPA